MDARIHSTLVTEAMRAERRRRRTGSREGLVMRWVRP